MKWLVPDPDNKIKYVSDNLEHEWMYFDQVWFTEVEDESDLNVMLVTLTFVNNTTKILAYEDFEPI